MSTSPPTQLRDAIIAGALAGVCAGLVFATAHAFIIVPIWDRMFGGLVFGAIAGAISGWSYAELYGQQDPGLVTGAKYGALLWLAVAPVSAVDAVLRATGIHQRFETLTDIVAIVLALSGGALWGWLRTRRRRGVLAGASAAVALMLAMGGPVPVGRNVWAFGIFLAVLPASIVAGTILGTSLAALSRRSALIAPR